MIKNAGNKNIMEKEKYTVKSAGVPLFPTFSTINIFEDSQPRVERWSRIRIPSLRLQLILGTYLLLLCSLDHIGYLALSKTLFLNL
jgi:hypothetical protein